LPYGLYARKPICKQLLANWKNLSLVSGLAVKQVLSTPDLILGVGGREGGLFEVGGSPSGENIRFDISHYN